MAGRPPVVTQDKQDAICQWIAEGNSLVSWCKANEIHYSTVMRALSSIEAFRDNYARAREDQAHLLAEQIIQIADDGLNDTYMTENGPATNHDVIARSRLRVDARKWYAAKLAPKKYGDKMEQEHSGSLTFTVNQPWLSKAVQDRNT